MCQHGIQSSRGVQHQRVIAQHAGTHGAVRSSAQLCDSDSTPKVDDRPNDDEDDHYGNANTNTDDNRRVETGCTAWWIGGGRPLSRRRLALAPRRCGLGLGRCRRGCGMRALAVTRACARLNLDLPEPSETGGQAVVCAA